VTPAATPGWLARVNLYRKLSGVPALSSNATWSNGDRLHSRYVVKNNTLVHEEDSGNQWYTAAGAAAGVNSNVMASSQTSTTNAYAIDVWMTGPFHAVGIVDPQLHQTGYGAFRESHPGKISMAAALDVLRGLGATPGSVQFPVKYPSGTTALPIRTYPGGETPDPLSKCGYTTPSGVPIMLQLGDGSVTPHVTAFSLKSGGAAKTACEFDETNYTNPDPSYQSLGRAVLGGRDAIVLIPRKPLAQGQTYTVSITANGHTYSWSFKVAANAQ
jgi:hypothetical protein